uniref:Signal sequence receptor subunit alpha n=1 Tax=Phakopsora pachyrhizi TaxID=170000 RepID=A0A0S1MJ49_PHAPC
MKLLKICGLRCMLILSGWISGWAVGTLEPESVEISASFPVENQFGVVFNGQSNKIILNVNNLGKHPIDDVMRIYQVLAPGSNPYKIPYFFNSEQREGDVKLKIWVEWGGTKGRKFQTVAYDSTVTIKEPPTRWFDPQLILLYIILGSGFGTVGYMVYVSYLKPHGTRAGSKLTKSKASTERLTTSVPKVNTPTGGQYEEEWIPAGHVQSSKKPAAESGEEASGNEGKPRRRKR